jgi:hypothetical protein
MPGEGESLQERELESDCLGGLTLPMTEARNKLVRSDGTFETTERGGRDGEGKVGKGAVG